MTTLNLDKFLSGHIFGFLFIFMRVGGAMMLFPAIGESYVAVRTRLTLAFLISFLLMGPLLPRLPAPPAAIADLARMLFYEIAVGLFFGTMLRLIMSALESAGSVVALQTGLSNATVFNPAIALQSPLSTALLSIIGSTLIFVTDFHHLLLRAIVATYDVFPPAGELMPGDMAQTVIQVTDRSFVLGVELALPFLVMGLLMYVALGMMQKLMPQVQLFLVALPVQIWGGLALLATTIAAIMTLWLRYFDASIGSFFGR